MAGIGEAGFAAADALLDEGAEVTVLDDSDDDRATERARVLEILGAAVRIGRGASAALPEGTDLVVASPGWRPTSPLLAGAAAHGVPV